MTRLLLDIRILRGAAGGVLLFCFAKPVGWVGSVEAPLHMPWAS
jgi:hypothetical protein